MPLLEEVPCDLCGGSEFDILRHASSGAHSGRDLVSVFRASSDVPLVDRLVRCRACELVFVSPRVHAPTIVDSYTEGDDPAFVSQAEAREWTFGRAVERIETLTGGPGRVFDIGTAGGSFLAAARKRGWLVDGCEPNKWLASWGRKHYGLDIRQGPLTAHDLPKAAYDVVTLWDVVEHLPHPSAIVGRAKELVKPGGFLIMTFPDFGSPSARLLGRFWPFLSSVHLFYFSKKTMERMLRAAGFEVVRTAPHTQQLELGYLLHRAGDVLGRPLRLLSRLARKAGAGRAQVPYRLGQTFIAARRIGTAIFASMDLEAVSMTLLAVSHQPL